MSFSEQAKIDVDLFYAMYGRWVEGDFQSYANAYRIAAALADGTLTEDTISPQDSTNTSYRANFSSPLDYLLYTRHAVEAWTRALHSARMKRRSTKPDW